jgi:hypothetical protein
MDEPKENVVPPAQPIKRKPGRQPGVLSPLKFKMSEDQLEQVIESATARIANGQAGAPRGSNPLLPPKDSDRIALARVCGISAEEFEKRLSNKLAAVADAVIEKIFDKIEGDEFKTGELSFLLAVALDKKARVDGKTNMGGMTVNNQVNIYSGDGPFSRKAIMDSLAGESAGSSIDV